MSVEDDINAFQRRLAREDAQLDVRQQLTELALTLPQTVVYGDMVLVSRAFSPANKRHLNSLAGTHLTLTLTASNYRYGGGELLNDPYVYISTFIGTLQQDGIIVTIGNVYNKLDYIVTWTCSDPTLSIDRGDVYTDSTGDYGEYGYFTDDALEAFVATSRVVGNYTVILTVQQKSTGEVVRSSVNVSIPNDFINR